MLNGKDNSEFETIQSYLMMVDIVGYTKTHESDQIKCVKHLLKVWVQSQEVLTPTISEKIVLIPTGDGFIVVFPHFIQRPSPVRAILNFLVNSRDITSKDNVRYDLRVGLHYGDCVPLNISNGKVSFFDKYNNFLGYHVNYVARLASCAKPRQIIASSRFVNRLEDDLRGKKLSFDRKIWYDSFEVAFKGDSITFSKTLGIHIEPSMRLTLAPEERTVYSLFCKDSFGIASYPINAVKYHGVNNYHDKGQVHLTNFQLVPDEELYALYRREPRPMIITETPFFMRLPFSILFSSGDDEEPKEFIPKQHEEFYTIDTESIDSLFGKPKKNDILCCLRCFEYNKGQLKLTYSKCEYTQSRASLIVPDRCAQQRLDRSLRRLLLTDERLPPLNNKFITNHIGVTAIVITQDHYPIIQLRSGKDLHSNIDSWSASVSGAVDWDDFVSLSQDLPLKNKKGEFVCTIPWQRLSELIKRQLLPTDRGIIRECWEEIGLSPDDLISVRLLGIAREFRRLGKPEFFYLIRSNISLGAVVKKAEEGATYQWEYGGKKLNEGIKRNPLPLDKEGQMYYWGNEIKNPMHNEITKVAFYFMLRDVVGARGKGPVP